MPPEDDDDFEAALGRAGLGAPPPSTQAGAQGGVRTNPEDDDFDAALQRAGIAGGSFRATTPEEDAEMALDAQPGVNASLGMTPGTDELARPAGSLVQPAQYARHDGDWSETLTDGAIGLGEGVSRGLGINPGRAAGFLAEKGAQVASFLGSDVQPGEYGARAESNARSLLADAHARSPFAAGAGEAVGEMAPGLAAMAATGGAVNPITMGIVSGGLSGLGNSEADSFGEMATDAGEGALFGGLAGGAGRMLGGASKYIGKAGSYLDELADDIANSPMTKKAAQWAGAGTGGSAGAAAGSLFGAPGTAAGGFFGAAAGGALAEKAVPAAIRGTGRALGGLGEGIAQAGSSNAAQTVATQALTQQYGRSNLSQASEKATDMGRGNLLGDAALSALQHDPSVLGDYQAEFAKAASSPDAGAVNALITRLAQKDPKFRAGPMLELQMMTAGF